MLPAVEAESLILKLVQPLSAERDRQIVLLPAALGRILATTVTSHLDFPHWDNSAMDGYAVRYSDVLHCTTEKPVTLEIVEEIPAGQPPQKVIQPGQAARILTGSMLPVGTDSVVMQEQTQRQGDRVTVLRAPEPESFVRHRASFYQANSPLLAAGIKLNGPEIAVLAAAQCTEIPVYRRPKVAILSTGDELVEPDQALEPGQIVDSNQYALAALLSLAGAEPTRLGIVPDRPSALKAAIAQAVTQADMVLSSGGVSVGDYDYVDRILQELGAELHIRAVAVKPGKPLTVATFGAQTAANMQEQLETASSPTLYPARQVLYFGLPGNPVSALVSFWRFVEPALRKLSGLSSHWRPVITAARSQRELKSGGLRETYLWGQLRAEPTGFSFLPAGGSYSSGNLINLAQSNALAIIPIGKTQIMAGETVQVMVTHRPLT
ncbi:MAG: molybdopterin molybdotransferase MoeA [Leptolyngbyaceae cyanobacterium SM1_1_3]|nr:molybdopterin molybdotransferase MoeA [Leptolyngbyaceae cyanobacterium SM1_1_3]NJN01896.1 molybdopterin molybdotransferase MoeA [Leptolyngbyaceae cyanobacterium RM1_1_2]NJO09677.1 molybdopterin molybdotransferase MoeA [Leptolyngbyaceae cyanobacterium SL_1_1]